MPGRSPVAQVDGSRPPVGGTRGRSLHELLPLCRRGRGRARRRTPLAPGRRGRRHDAAGQAAAGSSTRARSTRSPRGCREGAAARLRHERQDDDRRDGGRDPRARGSRLAHNRSGANLVSGVASTLLDARDAELALLEVDEGALPEVARRVRPRALLPRQPLPRPARPLRRAGARSPTRWRAAVAALPEDTARGRTGTIRRSASWPAGAPHALAFGIDDPAHVAAVAPARRRLEVLRPSADCRTSTRPPTSDTWATTAAPTAATRGRRSTWRRARSSSTGSSASPSS